MTRIGSLGLLLGLAAIAAACQNERGEDSAAEAATQDTGRETDAARTPTAVADGVDPRIASALAAAGVTLDDLPDLTTLKNEPGHVRLRAVMKSFTIALGTTCSGCHVQGATTGAQFAIDTPRKKVARKMWSSFVATLKTSQGNPIYCDTCHQGRMTFLDRSDMPSLRGWMKTNFVDHLARKDGAQHACATCHGRPFQGAILDAWRIEADGMDAGAGP